MAKIRETTALRVSVVINTLNRAQCIAAAIDGSLRQTHPAAEIIVVNGPSTDSSTSVIAEFRDRIRIVDIPQANLGISRNVGLSSAKGEIVAFVDDDAVPEPNWLEHLCTAYTDENVGAAGGFVIDAASGEYQWQVCTCARAGEVNTNTQGSLDGFVLPGADPFLYLAGCNMSFRRSAILSVGGFDESLEYGYDDAEACMRIIDLGYRIRVVPEAKVRHSPRANDVRDDAMMLRDPYKALASQAIFVFRNSAERGIPPDPEAVIGRQLINITRHGHALAQQGHLNAETLATYLARSQQGVVDGTRIGQSPRPMRAFAAPSMLAQVVQLFRNMAG
ncbi:glycosyltransferase [Methylobacterium sp. WL12]|uniref:glycosyltransferase family 2 protein n=1 Tax=Methylobacterium sp. WL12 TaxID=2603890 RepID=UPI0016501747|nr:glycosyltransferase [Methylobacterium sp. WL12]